MDMKITVEETSDHRLGSVSVEISLNPVTLGFTTLDESSRQIPTLT